MTLPACTLTRPVPGTRRVTGTRLLLVQFTWTPGLYPGPGLYTGPGYYPRFYGILLALMASLNTLNNSRVMCLVMLRPICDQVHLCELVGGMAESVVGAVLTGRPSTLVTVKTLCIDADEKTRWVVSPFLRYVRLMARQWCLLSVICRLSVTFVHPTQTVKRFRNIFTRFCTLGIWGGPCKILRRWAQGNPSAGGVKYKRGRQNRPIWAFRG